MVIIIILSVFGPIRSTYDHYQFQLDEEANACNFLAATLPTEQQNRLFSTDLNLHYFLNMYYYVNMEKDIGGYVEAVQPKNPEFYRVLNLSMKETEYILYGSNFGKELVSYYGINIDDTYNLKNDILFYNICEIYESNSISIGKGQ